MFLIETKYNRQKSLDSPSYLPSVEQKWLPKLTCQICITALMQFVMQNFNK